MKKILALVLALVMTMSLATISSGAAFSDADSVQYTEAVNALTAYGVLGGYADGSIRPQADVTRGAAAKMVAMVATGSNATTIGYYKGTTSFSDVPATHTFADAVAFCVARGIVAGYGDGNYGVADNVKGWAVAKMALVAMGYDAKAFGMEGAGSALNTITLASQKGLFAGLAADFNANEAASREECAQIVYNAMKQSTVVKGYVNSDGSYTYSESKTTLADSYSKMAEGVVVANKATGSDKGLTVLDNGTKLTNETGLDMIGHKVQYVDTKAYNTDGTVAFAVVDKSTVVEIGYDYKASADNNKAAFGADTALDASKALYFENYATAKKSASVADKAVDVGTYVVADKAIVSYLAPATYDIGSVKAYTAGTAAKNGSVEFNSIAANSGKWNLYTKTGETKVTEISLYDGIAKDDVVAVQQTGKLYTVSKLDTVSGKVTAVDKTANAQNLTIGGNVYYVDTYMFTSSKTDLATTQDTYEWADSMNKEVVAYLGLDGSVVALVKPVEATTDAGVVYVTATYEVAGAYDAYGKQGDSSFYVQAVDMSGKEVSFLTADKTYGGASAKSIQKVVMVYDTVLKTNVATFVDASVKDTVDVKAATLTEAVDATALKLADKYYYASGVKFIYVDKNLGDLKVTVKDGVQKLAAKAVIDVYSTKGATEANWNVQYVVVEGEFKAENVKSTDVVYVASATTDKTEAYTTAAGVDAIAYVYNVYVNGEAKTIKSAQAKLTAGFNTYEIDEDGMYVLSAMKDGTKIDSAIVSNLYGTLLTVGSLTDVEAKDAKIVDVDYAGMTAAEKEEATEITSLAGLFGDKSNATVAVVYTEANNVKTINTIYVLNQPSTTGTSTTTGA